MNFNDWLEEYYGWKIDICDLTEDEAADLYELYEKENKYGLCN